MKPVDLVVRLEWAAVLVACVVAYGWASASWWLFAALILAPDLSMLGYLAGPRAGAVAYNLVHALIGPIIAGAFAMLVPSPGWLLPVAIIWLAHIGLDRMLGYGLKYADGFQSTHMGRIGRGRRESA